MFNNITIIREGKDGQPTQKMKVPLAYGPKQKWLTLLTQNADQTKSTYISSPRMAFEKRSIAYDGDRKIGRMHSLKTGNENNNTKIDTQHSPVPYNLTMELYVMAKNSDDALEIVEQILPYFQPEYTISVKDNDKFGQSRDISITLDDVSYEDSYESDFITRRSIIYTLTFTAKFYLYGPITSETAVRSVQVDQYTDMPVSSPAREHRVTVEPDPVDYEYKGDDDNFGFGETIGYFEDAKDYDPISGEDI